MVLSDQQILARIARGDLGFSPPLDQYQLQQHSVDLRLGLTFLVPKPWQLTDEGRVAVRSDHLDPQRDRSMFDVVELEEGQCFDILPGEHVVVATLESIRLPLSLMAVLYPRSSVNRRGLSVDMTGIVDAGYEGTLLIPLHNNTQAQVVRLYPGERFCQLVFEEVGTMDKPQQSRWHRQDVVVTMRSERSEDEAELVRQGKISELKHTFSLSQTDKSPTGKSSS